MSDMVTLTKVQWELVAEAARDWIDEVESYIMPANRQAGEDVSEQQERVNEVRNVILAVEGRLSE